MLDTMVRSCAKGQRRQIDIISIIEATSHGKLQLTSIRQSAQFWKISIRICCIMHMTLLSNHQLTTPFPLSRR